MKRIIIGEGSYGCVHKPSIHCQTPPNPGFDYKKYVSKIMKTKNAEQELSEFVTIGKLDPTDEYHLGAPILCKPNLDEAHVKDDIKRCKHIKIDDIEANPDKYSLLVLKFGGPDLKALCNKYLVKYLEKDTEIRANKFWLEVHHLIKGLKFFKDNGIIHNDIKPQNILFDTTNGKMKYIDFGLMRTKENIIQSSKKSNNFLGIYHWSYPFDCGFMNKEQYFNYKNANSVTRTQRKNSLSELIVTDSKSNQFNLPITNPSAFSILFTYINPDNVVPNAATQYGYINSFFDGFNDMISRNKYETVLNYIADSIDVFSLGFTLQFMANCFKRLNVLSLEDFTRLSAFFHKMYDFNPVNRVIDIDTLLNEYENVLLEIGVLTRLGKSFKNNILVNKPPAPPVIIVESKSDEKSPPKHLSAALQELANNEPIIIDVKCKEGKEWNPITKRCVNKCPIGYERNDKFKCRKTKKIKSVRSKSVKICPDNKELNPKTNRCVKKCPIGYERNEKFECKKTKKIKSIKSKSVKTCPDNKELNPKTNRCVNKCPIGYLRNEKFECRKKVKTIKHPLMSNSDSKT
jgi:serine/threonine protein kinase